MKLYIEGQTELRRKDNYRHSIRKLDYNLNIVGKKRYDTDTNVNKVSTKPKFMILTYKLTNFFFFSLYQLPLVGTPWIFHAFLAWGSFFFSLAGKLLLVHYIQ